MKSRVLSRNMPRSAGSDHRHLHVLGLMGGSSSCIFSGHELLLASILLVRLINTFGFVQRGTQRLMTAQIWLSSPGI